MKHTHYFLSICLISLWAGCAFNRHVVLQTAIGPPPLVAESRSPEGGLVVYSAFDIHGGAVDSDQRHHSDYKIYSLNGTLLKDVKNKVRTYLEDPALVSQPPGRYKVTARAAAFGMVTVPVVIEAGKTTFVHLDGSELSSSSHNRADKFVSLPDGLIIGWRAKDDAEPK